MNTIKTNNYIKQIEAVLDAIGCELEAVEVVPNIHDWCVEHNIEESNFFRAGKCLRNKETGKHLILLAEEIKKETILSITAAMEIKGLFKKTESLNSSWDFLKHLLLHEIAHSVHPEFSELECDTWAFEQIDKLAM
jgi:hypothetical protein